MSTADEYFSGTSRYKPTRLLGRGGMGAVYEVQDVLTGGRVALKLMLAPGARQLLRFKQEFRAVAELHHPNLVQLFELGVEGAHWFFTMELIDGQNLLEVLGGSSEDEAPSAEFGASTVADEHDLEQLTETALAPARHRDEPAAPETLGGARPATPCDLDAFSAVMDQLLDALAFLHAHGIVHRDLKPSNILVETDGRLRLLDFGLASQLDHQHAISRPGSMMGTLAYMAPEQFVGAAVSPASDAYALGCLMFQLLTGRVPIRGKAAKIMHARLTQEPPRMDAQVSGVPAAWVAICQALMARDPEARPALSAVRAALGLRGKWKAPPVAASPRALPFVGRADELVQLEAALYAALGGSPGLVVISGDSGMGKSALLAELMERAKARGCVGLLGRCYEREQVPFVAFDRAIDTLAVTLLRWPRERLQPIEQALAKLEQVFPAVGVLRASELVMPATGTDPRERMQQAFDSLCEILNHVQSEVPLVIALDDLQWTDEASMQLLEAVLCNSAGRLLIVALSRPEGAALGHTLERVVRLAEQRHKVLRLALGPLSVHERMQLFDVVADGQLDPPTAGALSNRMEGNPLLVVQLIDYLARLQPEMRATQLDALASSSGVIEALVATLSEDARRVLAIAATAGGDLDAKLLSEISILEPVSFDAVIDELLEARMLRRLPVRAPATTAGPPGMRLDVFHDRVREVVYSGLEAGSRRQLHRQLAVALEARQAGGGRHVEALLRHWSEAGDDRRRRAFAIQAAELAVSQLAFRRAAELLLIALQEPESGQQPHATAARWARVGELFEWSGDLKEAAEAQARAIALWEQLPEDNPARRIALLTLRGRVGENLISTGQLEAGRQTCTQGAAMMGVSLDRSLPGLLWVVGWLKLWVLVLSLLPASMRRRSSTAWSQAQLGFLAQALRAMGMWPLSTIELSVRIACLGLRLDDHRVQFEALVNQIVITTLVFGRTDPKKVAKARRNLNRAEALAKEHGIDMGPELVRVVRAALWGSRDLQRARRMGENALETIARRGMSGSYFGNVSWALYSAGLVALGAFDDLNAHAERELSRGHLNFINVIFIHAYQLLGCFARAQVNQADQLVQRMESLLAGSPPSLLSHVLGFACTIQAVMQARFEDALLSGDTHQRLARKHGLFIVGFVAELWAFALLEAALGLARTGALPRRRRNQARRRARWLSRREATAAGCLGDRALALLAHHGARPHLASKALLRALDRSSVNMSSYRRWLCLEAAREMGALDPELAAEADALREEGGFIYSTATTTTG